MPEFIPTHEIVVGHLLQGGKPMIVPVMLVADHAGNGPAYTAEQFEHGDVSADWECLDGRWFFQGKDPQGGGFYLVIDLSWPKATARHACCNLAREQPRRCICECVTVCPMHGTRHHGTHD